MSFVFHNKDTCVKKEATKNDELFDCPMDSYDSADCSDLVGLYLLNEWNKIVDIKRMEDCIEIMRAWH